MISLSALRAWLNDQDIPDGTLAALEAGVVAWLERESGYYLGLPTTRMVEIDGPVAREEHLSGGGARPPYRVYLPELPAAALSIELWDPTAEPGAPESLGDWAPEDVADYRLEGGGPALRRGWLERKAEAWPTAKASIRVGYTAGYAVDNAPPEAHLLALRMIAWLYQDQDSLGAKVIRTPDQGVTYRTWAEAGLETDLAAFLPGRDFV